MLNVHHLELFYYVARAGGITPGLRLIPYGIQQPAVSSQLARLEESIGTKLFQRRPFSLTPAGQEVFEHIAPFFSQLGQLAGRVRQEAAQHLRLAASASVLREHLPALLKTIESRTPGLRVTLREATQHAAERMLREHEIDLAVALLETKPAAGIRCEPLLKIPMVLLVEAASPWRTAAEILRAVKRDPLPLIALPQREHLSLIFQKELTRREIAWPTRIEASSLELIDAYVGHGFGLGLSLDVPGRLPPPSFRVIPLPDFHSSALACSTAGACPRPRPASSSWPAPAPGSCPPARRGSRAVGCRGRLPSPRSERLFDQRRVFLPRQSISRRQQRCAVVFQLRRGERGPVPRVRSCGASSSLLPPLPSAPPAAGRPGVP